MSVPAPSLTRKRWAPFHHQKKGSFSGLDPTSLVPRALRSFPASERTKRASGFRGEKARSRTREKKNGERQKNGKKKLALRVSTFSFSRPRAFSNPPFDMPPADVDSFFSDVACHGRVDGDAVERAVAAFVARHTNADGEKEKRKGERFFDRSIERRRRRRPFFFVLASLSPPPPLLLHHLHLNHLVDPKPQAPSPAPSSASPPEAPPSLSKGTASAS